MNYWHKILLKHRVFCKFCNQIGTEVVNVPRRPHWPETREEVVCDAHARAFKPLETGLRERAKITRADLQTTGEKLPYFGHMRKTK